MKYNAIAVPETILAGLKEGRRHFRLRADNWDNSDTGGAIDPNYHAVDWKHRVTADCGGSIFGPGPYLKVPFSHDKNDWSDRTRGRVYCRLTCRRGGFKESTEDGLIPVRIKGLRKLRFLMDWTVECVNGRWWWVVIFKPQQVEGQVKDL